MKKTLVSLILAIILAAMPVLALGDGEFNAEGLPIVNEPITLRVLVCNDAENPADLNDLPIMKKLEEDTGIHIEWIMPGAEAYAEKRSLMLATGDLPDLIAGQCTDAEQIQYGSVGAFLPLEDLIDQYAPNLKAIFEARSWVKAMVTAPDGHIYATPTVNEGPWSRSHIILINKSWLEKLNLAMPTNTDELFDVLMAFKANDMNGDGIVGNETYVTFEGSKIESNRSYGFFQNYFGISTSYVTNFLDAIDGKVVFNPSLGEKWLRSMDYIHKLYDNGLIDPDAFTYTYPQYTSKISSEGVGICHIWEFSEELIYPEIIEQYDFLPMLKDDQGNDPIINLRRVVGGRNGWVITSACKYPEIAMRLIDYIYDPDISVQMMEGPYDQRLVWVEDASFEKGGYYVTSDAPEGMSQRQWKYANAPRGVSVAVLSDMYKTKVRLPFTDRKVAYQDSEYEKYADPEVLVPVYFTEEEALRAAQLKTEIEEYANRKTAEWVMNGKHREEYDAFLAECEKIGLSEYLTIWQAGYDRYLAALK